ncbi:hypothetical protein GMB51_09445 [Turicibacter sanguinis]|nr:hypothetical protein [Turicibacter sanguinis]MTN51326.1 hypothetical protein [Turicibacter sanguinis]MTN54472.1 hypothetical protein [Turicibacter sanguinis]MTN57605.1 hypothetical protein [Turicibacter sanguinis]MTN60670.1 hypothetical protein [Turicibacter sanguinis]
MGSYEVKHWSSMLSNFKIYDIHAMTEAGLSKEGLLKKLTYDCLGRL